MQNVASKGRENTRRTLRYLRDLIEDSDLLQRDLEDRMGWHHGYLSQLLNGHIDLGLRHLESLLGALNVNPAVFFRDLFEPARRRGLSRRDAVRLKVTPDVVRVYGFGIEAIRDLRRRLERCEETIEAVAKNAPREN